MHKISNNKDQLRKEKIQYSTDYSVAHYAVLYWGIKGQKKGSFGFMFVIPGVILPLIYCFKSEGQADNWNCGKGCSVITGERKFHQKQMK